MILIIKRDKNDVFRFAALQSKKGSGLVGKHGIDTSETGSIILIESRKHFTKPSAALGIAKHLSGGYPLLYGFIMLPKLIWDWLYEVIASNRYKWFGKKSSA